MKQQPQNSDNPFVQKAVAFFAQPVWSRLVEALYTKYITQGRIAGQIVLRDCSNDEQREIARFLKKKLPSDGTFTIRLRDFQQALDESGFACDLPTLLISLFPSRSHTTRPQQREQQAHSQQQFYDSLSAIGATLPVASRGYAWLFQGVYGRDELFRRYKNETAVVQEGLLIQVRTIAQALNHLPVPPNVERLALFAQRITGNPHYFDSNTAAGRIFFRALLDLTQRSEASNRADASLENDDLTTHRMGREISEQQQQRLLVYYEAGLLLDTISSTVTVFNLAYAEDHTGHADALVQYAGKRLLTLSLHQLLDWRRLHATTKKIYLFENPQVFEEIVESLAPTNVSLFADHSPPVPTLICTSGWPSIAVIRLLSLLTASSPDTNLYYSGDFDLQGLRIASHILTRYPGRSYLWRFDPASYISALHMQAAELDASDIAALQTLPEIFTPLTTIMQERKQRAYQEGITQLLLMDIRENMEN
ncbi:hypothetical protein KDA_56910 [Dictyobacter alpinus]|uniref:TIGR02679 family protein n=1 Tax=Dictyobacter alpinus TaxID=2014873 RepID=A0A402BG14_9CHLR|nr:TIGR02679 domain-containing protein [Dictyobacter alpinus]GCE30207.1 hypothetical protein KDA_56910 [Dictyobacter alpinus]